MSVKAMSWVWEQSRARNSARLVLLALADHAGSDGGDSYPSVARLATRCGLSERAVQGALQALEKLGEIVIEPKAGPRGTNRYRLTMTPADPAPPQILHPRTSGTDTPQILHQAPADPAPEPSGTVRDPSLSSSSSDPRHVPPTVWKKVAEHKLRTRVGKPVTDVAGWVAVTAANTAEQMGERAEWIWRTFEITETQLADVIVAGGSSPLLNSLRKREAS